MNYLILSSIKSKILEFCIKGYFSISSDEEIGGEK
jgi:hypothetical protein